MKFYTRQLTINDWSILKKIRLEALTLHPNYFDPSTDEFKMTDDEWKARLDTKDSASFGLYNDKNEIIGLTGIYRDKKDPKVAWMISSFIKPAYRRQGLTRYLYEARIQWALDQKDIETLGLYHRSDNEISRKSHQNFNFEYVNEYEPVEWPNGEIKSFVEYRLNLKTFRKTP